ncbi:RNA-guided endonuclease TnpB family protein [Streptomyces sp. NPDC059489]|uniref:RNA-guided endonuclease InsQ/TnpB family protein n=1 Tax=Streptomyces sp. NPDC059489 TaxID=3346849 RepID=UPI0036856800
MLDADIEACFDSIDHTALMDRLRTRVKDKHVLMLVKVILKAGVMTETGHFEDNPTGTPPSIPTPDRTPAIQSPASLARTEKGSARRKKAWRQVGRLQHETALRRSTALHALTKPLVTRFAAVAIQDFNGAGMPQTARDILKNPGRRAKQKAGLNRAILDTSPGKLRRQLTYEPRWYGSAIAILDRRWPSSKTCSACGWQSPHLMLADRTFDCTNCTLTIDRDFNAACNIATHAATVDQPGAPGRGGLPARISET